MVYTIGQSDLYNAYNYDSLGGGSLVPLGVGVAMPSDFTMVFTFDGITNGLNGLDGNNELGLPVFQPPGTGTNYGDYWLENGGTWSLVTNNLGPVAFGIQLNADPAPEPAALSLGALGLGVVLLNGLIKRRK